MCTQRTECNTCLVEAPATRSLGPKPHYRRFPLAGLAGQFLQLEPKRRASLQRYVSGEILRHCGGDAPPAATAAYLLPLACQSMNVLLLGLSTISNPSCRDVRVADLSCKNILCAESQVRVLLIE